MVFPRAMLDKTVSPTVMTAGGGSFCLFFFFYSEPSKQISLFACAPQSRAIIKLDLDVGLGGSAGYYALGSLARLCKLLLGSCVLLFFALYTPGSPPISGAHWSVKQSKLQSSHSLTASSRPQQAGRQAGEVTAKLFQVRDHPRKHTASDLLLDSHCGVEGTSASESCCYQLSFIYDFHICVVGEERRNLTHFICNIL